MNEIKKRLERLNEPDSRMSAFKDRIFKLLWIQSLKVTPLGNRFTVLFKDIKSDMHLIDLVNPECLWYYTVGAYYKNNHKVSRIPSEGDTMDIAVTSTRNNKILKIRQVIKDAEYALNQTFMGAKGLNDCSNYNKEQFCVVLENAQQEVIFPCALIGATYYFLSSSMKDQIFAQNLQGLYETVEFDPANIRKALIKMKPGSADSDAPHIVRFHKNEFAKQRWNAIGNNFRNEINRYSKTHVRFIADFPIRETFNMTVRGLRIAHLNDREKILVFDIVEEHSTFDFDDLEIVRNEYEVGTAPRIDDVIRTKAHITSDSLVNKAPSSLLATASINMLMPEKNPNISKMNKTKTYIAQKGGDIHHTFQRDSSVDISVSSNTEDGEVDVRRGHMQRQDKEVKEKECFNLDDFKKMIGHLQGDDIDMVQVNGPFKMPQRKNRKYRTISLREVYGKGDKGQREYLTVTFVCAEYYVCLIEIDQNMLPNGSATYVLASKGSHNFAADIDEFLEAFVKYEGIKKISKEIEGKGIRCLSKNHPVKKEDKFYENWCEDLLMRI